MCCRHQGVQRRRHRLQPEHGWQHRDLRRQGQRLRRGDGRRQSRRRRWLQHGQSRCLCGRHECLQRRRNRLQPKHRFKHRGLRRQGQRLRWIDRRRQSRWRRRLQHRQRGRLLGGHPGLQQWRNRLQPEHRFKHRGLRRQGQRLRRIDRRRQSRRRWQLQHGQPRHLFRRHQGLQRRRDCVQPEQRFQRRGLRRQGQRLRRGDG